MQLPSLFKTYKNRQFTYKPLFYNQVKEGISERVKEFEWERNQTNIKEYKIGITRGSIRKLSKRRNRLIVHVNFRLAIITLVLLGLAWYLLH